MFRIRIAAQKHRITHFCGKRQLKKALQVLSVRAEQKELGVEELVCIYEGSKANRLAQTSITATLKRFMYSTNNSDDKFVSTDLLRILKATINCPEDSQPNEKALVSNMISTHYDKILQMPLEQVAEVVASIAELRGSYMLPGFAPAPELAGLCRHLYRNLEKMDPKGYSHLLSLKRLVPNQVYGDLFDLALESLLALTQEEPKLLRPLFAFQVLRECVISYRATKADNFLQLSKILSKHFANECVAGNKEYLSLMEEWLSILSQNPLAYDPEIVKNMAKVRDDSSGIQVSLLEFLAINGDRKLPASIDSKKLPLHMTFRLGLIFEKWWDSQLLEQVEFQNFNYIMDSPLLAGHHAASSICELLAIPKATSGNNRGRKSPVVSDTTATSFFKFLNKAVPSSQAEKAVKSLANFTKSSSKDEMMMILSEFLQLDTFSDPLLQYIQAVATKNADSIDWDFFANALVYNDYLFAQLKDSKQLEKFLQFILQSSNQSMQWKFLLSFSIIKKLEVSQEVPATLIESVAVLLHHVLVAQSKGSGTLSVDMLVKAASFFKAHQKLTLQGVVGLLEAVSSSQSPKLATLQEYLVLLLQGIKSTKKSTDTAKGLVFLNTASAPTASDIDDDSPTPAPAKKDLSRYYLILKHLLASRQIKFEENYQLSKLIAPIYLPELKTGIFVISIQDSGVADSHPEAKLVKRVTRLIFERMIEGTQAAILYSDDFDHPQEGYTVESILEQIISPPQE